MDKIVYLILIIGTLLGANNLDNLLVDISNNNRIELKKYNLTLGWNEKDKVFIASGKGIFDFNSDTFISDVREFSNVAALESQTSISEFLGTKMSAIDTVQIDAVREKINSKVSATSKNMLHNAFTIFQEMKYDKTDNIYTITNYMMYSKSIKKATKHSNLSLQKYIDTIDPLKVRGARIFIDNKGAYYLLLFSAYPINENEYTSRVSAENLAKKDITAMLKSTMNSSKKLKVSLESSEYSSKAKQNIKNINVKNIKKIMQKKLTDRISGEKCFFIAHAYRLSALEEPVREPEKQSKKLSLETKLSDKLNKW